MPKPVKKAVPKKKRSSDPTRRGKQLTGERLTKAAQGQPPWAKDFKPAGFDVTFGAEVEHEVPITPSDLEKFDALYRAKMAALGSKGGKVSGAKRMEMPAKQRKAIARKAAAARWGKK
jgi:hypothetical protein